jgi:hypothetical protein
MLSRFFLKSGVPLSTTAMYFILLYNSVLLYIRYCTGTQRRTACNFSNQHKKPFIFCVVHVQPFLLYFSLGSSNIIPSKIHVTTLEE